MRLKLRERLQSLKLLAGLAEYLKQPNLENVFAVSAALKDSVLPQKMEKPLVGG